ncbi:MAG: 5'-nucleotidase C-terminal domain-containing protein [Hyphomicrobiales bacterium]|nr:5'-nucleotidase C-terminal domain-containing protein [Hyphomicrobiales bacterium]
MAALSRRALLAGVATTPFVPTTFAIDIAAAAAPSASPSGASSPQASVARRLAPNPVGAFERLYRFDVDPLAGPVADLTVPVEPLAAGATRRLTVMHFNDLHNNVTVPHPARGETRVFAQIVQKVRAARAGAGKDDVVLFLSGGDDQTGSLLDELLAFTPEETIVHPSYRSFVVAGVDAAVLGNHEFDRGTAVLADLLARNGDLPALSANIVDTAHLTRGRHYHPALIGVAKGLRIGLLGLTTPEDTRTGTAENPGLSVADPAVVVRNLLPALGRACDVVVILSHLGYGGSGMGAQAAGAERRLALGDTRLAELAAELTDRPVLIVGGHTHTALNAEALEPRNFVAGRVAIVQAGFHGSHLGEATLELTREAGGARLVAAAARLHALKKSDLRVPAADPKAASLQQTGDWDEGFQGLAVTPLLAKLDERLTETIATADADASVGGERTRADRYVRETAIADLMNDLLVARSAQFPDGAVDIAVFNATGLVAGIPEQGPITFADWFQVMPFADSIQILTMTGRDIQAMLDSNAQRVVRPEELAATPPIDLKSYVSRGFLHFSAALRYRIALGASAKEAKAVDVTIKGRPAAEALDTSFRVAFGSYIGNGGFAEAWNGREIAGGLPPGIKGYDLTKLPKRDTGFVYRNEIVAQIRTLGRLTAAAGAKTDGRLIVAAN